MTALIAMYGASKRGNKTLIYGGFEFWKHRVLKNGHVVVALQ